MMFSKSCEYALRAVIYLCINTKDGSRLNIKSIASEIESPEPFTAKILQVLVKRRIISSQKGPNGGFYIDPAAPPVPVIKVIEAIDGEYVFDRCGLGLKQCSDAHPCPIHNEFKSYSLRLRNLMERKTIQDLAKEIKAGHAFLTNG